MMRPIFSGRGIGDFDPHPPRDITPTWTRPFGVALAAEDNSIISHNLFWETVIQAQAADVQYGQQVTYDFGQIPYSGEAAEHPSYGYRHKHRLMGVNLNKNCRATIMNAIGRRYAYIGGGAKYRGPGYEWAGKPWDPVTKAILWQPEFVDDTVPPGTPGPNPAMYPAGSVLRPDGKIWTGHEADHNWDILWEVMTVAGAETMPCGTAVSAFLGITTIPISVFAMWRLWYLAEATAGQVRNPYELFWQDQLKVGNGSDRRWANQLRVLLRAAQMNCTNATAAAGGGSDIDAASLAYLDAAIEFYDHVPGCALHPSIGYPFPQSDPALPAGTEYIIPIQYAWSLVSLWDWLKGLQSLGTGHQHVNRISRLIPITKRMARWVVDTTLACTGANAGKQAWRASFPTGALYAPATNTVLPSISSIVTNHFEAGNPQQAWSFRALRIANQIGLDTGDATLANDANAKWTTMLTNDSNLTPGTQIQNDSKQWRWLVGADMKYAVAGAVTAAGGAGAGEFLSTL